MEPTTAAAHIPEPAPPRRWWSLWLFRWPVLLIVWFRQPKEQPKKKPRPRNRLGIQSLEDRFSPTGLLGIF